MKRTPHDQRSARTSMPVVLITAGDSSQTTAPGTMSGPRARTQAAHFGGGPISWLQVDTIGGRGATQTRQTLCLQTFIQ